MPAVGHRVSSLPAPGPYVQLLALIASAATALALLTTAQAGVALAFEGQTVPWTGLLKARLVDWYACALFMPALIAIARRYPIRRDLWQRHLPILLLAGVPIAVAKEVVFVAIGNFMRPGVFDLADILSEDVSYEVMAVWAFTAVAQLLVLLESEASPARRLPAAASIRVRTRQGLEDVRLEDIEYIDAQGNYARLVTSRGRFLVRETMVRLDARLGDEFLRVHRSVIVRRNRVVRVEPAANGGRWIHLACGARVRAGRSYREAIRQISRPG